jgi:hypothetical protein
VRAVFYTVLGQAIFTALVIYASTLSFTTLRAILGGIGLLTAMGLSVSLLGKLIAGTRLWRALVPPDQTLLDWPLLPFLRLEQVLWMSVVGIPLLVLAFFAYSNFKRIEISRRRFWGQIIFLVLPTPLLAITLPILAAVVFAVMAGLWRPS